MDPSAHRWTPSDFPGVEEKLLGVFGEGRTKIAFYRLDPGAVATFGPRRAVTTLFSLEGDMIVDGVDLAEGTTVEVGVGETVSISTKAGVEVYVVDLPDLSYWS
jgi:hypothetical protein